MDKKWWTLIAVSTGTFMLLLDVTVVNVALPDIQHSLHSSFSDLQWVVDACALTLAAFLLTAGVLGDMFGRREVFAIGLGVFSVSSLVCGFSTSSLMLNLARGAQGVGGAVMFATSLSLIAGAFQGRERGTAFGIYGAVIGGAVAIGPLVGGAITSGIGWRWIFFVNVPIGVIAIALTLLKLEESKDPNSRRVDWLGFVSFSVALFLLVFALVRGNDKGWTSPTIVGLLAGAVVLLAVFLIAEWKQSEPMLDLHLFKRPAMVGVSIATFAIAASIFALFLYITLYLQDVLGYGPLQAGLRFLPLTVLAFIVAPISGKLTVKVHSRYLMGSGLLLVAVGSYLMAFTHAGSAWTVLLPGFLVSGVGIGVANPVIASASVAVVPPERSGMASGSSNTFRQVGIATGIAGLGAVFQSQILSKTHAALGATEAGRSVLAKGGPAKRGHRRRGRASSQCCHPFVDGSPRPHVRLPVWIRRDIEPPDAHLRGDCGSWIGGGVRPRPATRLRCLQSWGPVDADRPVRGRPGNRQRRLNRTAGAHQQPHAGTRSGWTAPSTVCSATADPTPRGAVMQTRLTEILGIEHPVMLAGMGGVSYAPLVTAVSDAGGFGCLGASTMSTERMVEEMTAVRSATERPFGVDLLTAMPGDLVGQVEAIIAGGAKVFVAGLGVPAAVVELCHQSQVLVVNMCGKVDHARRAVDAGCDLVVAQGTEAGGHTGTIATMPLVPQVVDAVGEQVPVVAAGGIFDGRGLAAALALGADGVWIGTRFIATPEARAVAGYKDALVRTAEDGTVVSRAFSGKTMRVVRNQYTSFFDEHPDELAPFPAQLSRSMADHAFHLGGGEDTEGIDPDRECYPTGQGVGAIRTLIPAATLLHQIVDEATGILSALGQL